MAKPSNGRVMDHNCCWWPHTFSCQRQEKVCGHQQPKRWTPKASQQADELLIHFTRIANRTSERLKELTLLRVELCWQDNRGYRIEIATFIGLVQV